MKPFRDMSSAGQSAIDAIVDTDGEEDQGFDWHSPDAAQAIWAEAWNAPVEISPNERRPIVEIRERPLVRVCELLETDPLVSR